MVRYQRSKSVPANRASEENKSVQSTEAAANGRKLDTEPTYGCTDSKKKASSNAETQLRQEILMLEKRLQDEVSVRCALENALGYRSSSQIITDASVIPKAAAELIKEISVLEAEVEHLEQYLLSLYRKTFDEQFTSLSPPKKHEGFKTALSTPWRRRLDLLKSEIALTKESKPEAEYQALSNERKETNGPSEEKLLDSNVQRSHSSLSQRTAPSVEALGKAQPLSMMEVWSDPENDGTNTFDSTPSEASSEKKETLQPIHSMVSVDHNTPNTKRKRSNVKSDSKVVPCSDAYKTTSPRNHGPDTFDSTPSEKKETLQPIPSMVSANHNTPNTKKKSSDVKSVLGSGPLMRSRARRSMQIR